MSQTSRRRACYSAEQRAALVREFRTSHETQQAFARRHRIKWTTLRNWL
jgi:transposase-like protein